MARLATKQENSRANDGGEKKDRKNPASDRVLMRHEHFVGTKSEPVNGYIGPERKLISTTLFSPSVHPIPWGNFLNQKVNT